MLYRELLTTELDKQRTDFQRFSATQSSDLTAYLEKLEKLCRTPSAEIGERLQNIEAPGALPSD